MQIQDEAKPYDSINVTPMLDLVYVLMVVFIIMTTSTVAGLKIDLPKPSNKPSTDHKEVRIIQIMPNGNLLLNGASISIDELESRLTAAHARDPEMPVVIKGDPQAYYQMVIDIVNMAARLNIANVGLVTSKIGT